MNPYIQNLNRIEFSITSACTGRCKHCSEGEHTASGGYIDGDTAAQAVQKLCTVFRIQSLMTFGGEPLLYLDEVCKIHSAAREVHIPKRQIITNGFFSQDTEKIKSAALKLFQSGVNDIFLSVDAFHQETIPLKPVKTFAEAVKSAGIPLRAHPAWLAREDDPNPYNLRTLEILKEFEAIGIAASEGNVIFPSGNARKYLHEYFDWNQTYVSPYTENPEDIRAVCILPNGDVLGGNIYQTDILDIVEGYTPTTCRAAFDVIRKSNPDLSVKKLSAYQLPMLSELFRYNDIEKMLAENTRDIENGAIDIFGLFKGSALVGELHVMYRNTDSRMAVQGKRAYLFAFRIRRDSHGKGFGQYLLENVLHLLSSQGYSEFTVGVEDDNLRAIHIYRKFGFTQIIARKQEEYQGDTYEYNLYLKNESTRHDMS